MVLTIGFGGCTLENKLNQQQLPKPVENPGIPGAIQLISQNTVMIEDFSFQPSTLTVPVGTTVTWHNQGRLDHTVTGDTNGMFDSKVSPGTDFSFLFSTPGTFNYHCSIHTSMHGTIVVTGPAASGISLPTIPKVVTGTAGPIQTGSVASGVPLPTIPKVVTGTAGPTPTDGKSPVSWSEMPLSGEKLNLGTSTRATALQFKLNQNQSSSQSKILQFSQYYQVTPQAPSKPLTSPTKYELKGQEPATLYFGTSQKAVPYSLYQSYFINTGLNSLWIQGSSSWTQYAQVPQGASLSLLATTSSGGNGYLYEINPDGTTNKNGYYFFPYNQIGFYADEVGEHLLLFVIDGQPSNVVVIDVVAYQPPYASVAISSSWLRGYNIYVDGSYQATEGTTGEPPGVVTVPVPGNQYHTIAVYGAGFSFSDSKFFNAGWAYTLNV